MSVVRAVILPFICLRTQVLGCLVAVATYLAKPRYQLIALGDLSPLRCDSQTRLRLSVAR